MKINEKKTTLMLFNKSLKFDFQPEFSFQNGGLLDVVDQSRLLGVQLHSSLRWNQNTNAIVKKSLSKMWLLRRMKGLKMDSHLISDYYLKEIRPLAEQSVAAWNSAITKAQVSQLESIQKAALKIILGPQYKTYDDACKTFNLLSLDQRRQELCVNFATKLYQSKRCEQFFNLPTKLGRTRNENLVIEPTARTKRLYNAPHAYLARLVNANKSRISSNP